MIFVGYFLYKVFEIIPSSAREKYLFLKKPFLYNMDSSDEEVIIIGAIAKSVL